MTSFDFNYPYKPLKLYIYPDYSKTVSRQFAELLGSDELRHSFNAPWFTSTQRPDEADFFLFPHRINRLFQILGPESCRRFLSALPLYTLHEKQHIFFMYDDSSLPLELPSVLFRLSHDRFHQDRNSITLPPSIANGNQLFQAKGIFKYHFSFTGSIVTHFSRLQMIASFLQPDERLYLRNMAPDIEALCNSRDDPSRYKKLTTELQPRLKKLFPRTVTLAGLRGYLNITLDHHHLLSDEEQLRTRNLQIKTIRDSVTVLCPRGRSVYSIRFFETLAAGRIPILISDNYIPPLAHHINYNDLIFRIPQNNLLEIKSFLHNIFKHQTTDELGLRCYKARKIWQNYFDPAKINRYFYHSLIDVKRSNFNLKTHYHKLASQQIANKAIGESCPENT